MLAFEGLGEKLLPFFGGFLPRLLSLPMTFDIDDMAENFEADADSQINARHCDRLASIPAFFKFISEIFIPASVLTEETWN